VSNFNNCYDKKKLQSLPKDLLPSSKNFKHQMASNGNDPIKNDNLFHFEKIIARTFLFAHVFLCVCVCERERERERERDRSVYVCVCVCVLFVCVAVFCKNSIKFQSLLFYLHFQITLYTLLYHRI
jgi:hypothetical protein